MALRRDYSMTKDIDFDENKKIYQPSYDYESADSPGRFSKKIFTYFLKIYEGVCGQDKDIERIFSSASVYSKIDINDEDYTFYEESLRLKELYTQIRDYEAVLEEANDQLGRKIDKWLANINPQMLNPEQKQQDIQFVGQVETTLNRRVFVYESKSEFEKVMQGGLTDGYPLESPAPDSPATSLDLPVMSHIPREDDIDKEELAYVPLMQVLYNIAAQDYYAIMKMFHDYENGNVCVRLWKKDNGKYAACFFSINKLGVYLNKVGELEQKSFWPGLVEAAITKMGCENDKQALAEAILGPEYEKYDKDYLAGPNDMPDDDSSEEFSELVHAYVKCVYDIYGAMLLTNSLVVEDEASYVKLMFSVKELLYALTNCLFRSFDMASDTIAVLKKNRADYTNNVTESGRLSEPTVKKRLSICETLDELLYLLENDCDYHNDPRGYYELFLAKQIAHVILTSVHNEITPEAVNEKAMKVMTDKAFKRKVSKMNIHILKHSTLKMVESVLASIEGKSKPSK